MNYLVEALESFPRDQKSSARLSEIAVMLEEMGEPESAIAGELENRIRELVPETELWVYEETLSRVAGAQMQAGRSADAFTTVRSIESQQYKDYALTNIAVAQVVLNRDSDALDTIRQIKDDSLRQAALKNVAIEQVQSGRVSEALHTTYTMNPFFASSTLREISLILARQYSGSQDSGTILLREYPLLAQLDPNNYRDKAFLSLLDTIPGTQERTAVPQLACAATVYTMLERGRGNTAVFIDDIYADPREHNGNGPGAIAPEYVGKKEKVRDASIFQSR